ncbi:MAG: hypothetical protein ACI4JY_08790 [Oscillospiraceae bacterium]
MNLFELAAKITLDTNDYENGIDKAKDSTSSFASKIGSGLKTAAKIGTAAISAAAAGIAKLTSEAVKNYAEYEQLVGGAKLMFGDAYDFIADKAAKAFSTVQMSQNDYLQQVNGFATGLKTALGGNEQAAAELADKIITAEADIVAATGTSQEAVQNAFNGIMKSNYTMLDNLQLGITPTKEGFQEVIDKVNEWNTAQGNATNYQIDNLADAQSALLDYIEMQGLSGYAGAEAADTIQGATASMKAAWSNLVTGVADDTADFDTLINNFVASVATAASNIIPRVETALTGVVQLVDSLAPIIIDKLPQLVDTVLPSLVSAALNMVQSIVDIAPSLVEPIINAVIQLITGSGLAQTLGAVLNAGIEIIMQLVESLTSTDTLNSLIETALELVLTLTQGLIDAIPELLNATPKIIGSLVASIITELPNIIATGIELLIALGNGIMQAIPELIASTPNVILAFTNGILNNLDTVITGGVNVLLALAKGIINAIPQMVAMLPRVISSIVDTFKNYNWSSIGSNIVAGIKQGVSNAWKNFKEWFKSLFGDIIGIAKKILGIASPSKVFKQIGAFTTEGLALGIEDKAQDAFDAMGKVSAGVVGSYGASISTEFSAGTKKGSISGGISLNVNIGTFNNNSGEDIENLAERLSEAFATSIRRKEAAYA